MSEASLTTNERIKRPWEEQYRDDDVETMPWFCPLLDKDVAVALQTLGMTMGRVLDLGTGPGTQAIELAKRGFEVTGSDISPSAVKKATLRAKAEGVFVRFIHDDVLASRLSGPFDLIIDRGCFHAIETEQQQDYICSVARLLDANAHLLLKTFHKQETREEGPSNRFEAADIAGMFSGTFELIECHDTTFESTMDSDPKALFCILKKSAAVNTHSGRSQG